MSSDVSQMRQSRWYFGGVASGGAACFTHPLDLLKVTLQTQQVKMNFSVFHLNDCQFCEKTKKTQDYETRLDT